MGMETGVGEALAVILAEEAALAQEDVVDLVARTLAVQPVPLLLRHLAFSANIKSLINNSNNSNKVFNELD